MTDDIEEAVEPTVVSCPATITTPRSGDFYVKDVNAWTFDENGALATGYWTWDREQTERTVWFPLRSISHIEYHFDELVEFSQGDD